MRARKKLAVGLYLYGAIVYGEKKVDGKVWRRKSPYQGSTALNTRGNPSRELLTWKREFDDMVINHEHKELEACRQKFAAASVDMLCAAYLESAAVERSKNGDPREATVKQNVCTFKRIAKACGVDGADRINLLTPERIEAWLAEFCGSYAEQQGARARTSAWNQVAQGRSLWAAWTRPYYEKIGLKIPEALEKWPRRKRDCSPSYRRPPEQLRQKTMRWYKRWEKWHPQAWVAATLMLQLGMRCGDAAALTWDSLHAVSGRTMLRYVPSKTHNRTAASREVTWMVSEDIMERLRRHGGKEFVIPGNSRTERYNVFQRIINPLMRRLGWDRSKYGKACYELRKLCVDAIYRKYGLEKAVQISGDNAATVSKFYSDPNLTDNIAVDVTAIA